MSPPAMVSGRAARGRSRLLECTPWPIGGRGAKTMQAVARMVDRGGARDRGQAAGLPVVGWLAAVVVATLLLAIAWAERGADDAR